MDEWLELAVSCPLCKQSAREGLLRQRRGRRRATPAGGTSAVFSSVASRASPDASSGGAAEVRRERDDSGSSSGVETTPEIPAGRGWWTLRWPLPLELVPRPFSGGGGWAGGRAWLQLRTGEDEDPVPSEGNYHSSSEGQPGLVNATDDTSQLVPAERLLAFLGDPLRRGRRRTGEGTITSNDNAVFGAGVETASGHGFDGDRVSGEGGGSGRAVEEFELPPVGSVTPLAAAAARVRGTAISEIV